MVYAPREDSYLLAEHVKMFARGKVLDMCAGTGIQGITSMINNKTEYVLFADKDPEAIAACKNNVKKIRSASWKDKKNNKITAKKKNSVTAEFIESDLFSGIREKDFPLFDTIICNPPYLPDDPRIKDIALDGGPEGWEFILRFLNQAKEYLADDGVILLIASSLTKREKVESIIRNNGFYEKVLESRRMEDGEELIVYKIKKRFRTGKTDT